MAFRSDIHLDRHHEKPGQLISEIINGRKQSHKTLENLHRHSGCYKISETGTPAGYVKTDNNDIYFDIVNGEVTRYMIAYTGTARTSQEAISETDNIVEVTYIKEDKVFTVGNQPGAVFPNTGGPGTWLFTVFGSFLILLSGALLWRRRRLI